MQNQLENRAYAGFVVRLIAFVIDSIIAACVVSTIKTPFTLASSAGIELFDANFLFHYSFLDVLDYVGVAAYFILLTYFTHTTLGKMFMGLEVVTSNQEWTLLNVIYRETIGRFFSSLMCIGYFAVIVNGKKQGFHDMFCDTYVVYKHMVPREETVVAMSTQEAENSSSPVVSAILDDEIIEEEIMPQTEGKEEVSIVETSEKEEQNVAPVYYAMPEKTDEN